jgi:hypothetical protein
MKRAAVVEAVVVPNAALPLANTVKNERPEEEATVKAAVEVPAAFWIARRASGVEVPMPRRSEDAS